MRAAGATALAATSPMILTGCSNGALKKGEVLHTVTFTLKHADGSAAAQQFITDAQRILTAVPGVQDFRAYRQCSPKNEMQYGFLMLFKDQAAMDTYTAHPDHVRFVTERWDTEVIDFQESDFESI